MLRSIVALLVALLVAVLSVSVLPVEAGPGFFETLTISTKSGDKTFQVEVMRTNEDRMRGMMFRRSLDPDKGMLFSQETESPAAFWMKNTYVSLDIIFIRADGVIHRIEKSAEPLSTREIASGVAVMGVLELLAGTSDKLGIAPGDKVSHPLFKSP